MESVVWMWGDELNRGNYGLEGRGRSPQMLKGDGDMEEWSHERFW